MEVEPITDVSLEIEFQTSDGEVIETMSLELAQCRGAHLNLGR